MQSFLSSLVRHGRILAATRIQKSFVTVEPCRSICSTPIYGKVHKGTNTQKFPSIVECDSDVLKPYFKEIKELEQTLCEQLDKRLSLRTDLRLYEDFNVTCPDGKHKLANLGQISKKGQLVVINFSKNPSVIQHAKKDLQAAIPDINVQQEGASLYIKTPPISRERRMEMVAKVRISLLNDYKKALNNTYTQYSKRFDALIKNKDELERNRKIILNNKRTMETRAEALIKEREEGLMAEIV